MVCALCDIDNIFFWIFFYHKPGIFCRLFHPANAKASSLANRVVGNARMRANFFAIKRKKWPFAVGNILAQKLAKVSFADEADACAILFLSDRKSCFSRYISYLTFHQMAYWKEHLGEDPLIECVDKVGLVFSWICSFQK